MTQYPNWACCNACTGLVYPSATLGVCPAAPNQGPHDDAGSGTYTLDDQSASTGWSHCDKCGGLWQGTGSGGTCPAGGAHDTASDQPNLTVPTSGSGQSGWCRCSACLVLFYKGPGSAGGSCPASPGQPHTPAGGENYIVVGGSISASWTALADQPPSSATLSPLTYAENGALWALDKTVPFSDSAQNVYLYDGATWLTPDAYLTDIAEDRAGLAWGVNSAEIGDVLCNIYVMHASDASNGYSGAFTGVLTSIGVGPDSDVWGINANVDGDNVFRYTGGTLSWATITSASFALTQIAVGGPTPGGAPGVESSVWAINANQTDESNVYRYVGGSNIWESVPGVTLSQIAAGPDGTVVGIDATQNIWAYNFSAGWWVQVTGQATAIAAGAGGILWIVAPGSPQQVMYTVIPETTTTLHVEDRVVYVGVHALPDGVQLGNGRSPGRLSRKVVREHWLDESYRPKPAAHNGARSTAPGDEVSTGLEVAKFVWDIVKDGRPVFSGPTDVQSSILNPSDPLWTDYQNAIPGQSAPVTFKRRNGFGMTVVEFTMQFGGTYAAVPANSSITAGYYVPSMGFLFTEGYLAWGFSADGAAVITQASNLGTATQINPYAVVQATLEVSTWFTWDSDMFQFNVKGQTGFSVGAT